MISLRRARARAFPFDVILQPARPFKLHPATAVVIVVVLRLLLNVVPPLLPPNPSSQDNVAALVVRCDALSDQGSAKRESIESITATTINYLIRNPLLLKT